MKRSFFILFCLFFSYSFIQGQKRQGEGSILIKKIRENQNLLINEPERALRNSKALLNEAVQLKNGSSQLLLLDQQCWYYTQVKDLDKLLMTAEQMEKTGAAFGDVKFQAIAHIYFSQIFLYNNMLNEANQEFSTAMEIAENSSMEELDKSIFIINSHSYISNIYRKIDLRKTINHLLIAAKEINGLKAEKKRKKFAYLNFSNLGSAYYDHGKTDSAEYFIKRSIAEHPADYKDDGIMMVNNGVIGDIYRDRKQYEKSKYYYKKAEALANKNGNPFNIREVYNGLYQIYKVQDSSEKAEKYREKLNVNDLQLEKNKNRFLHSYIKKEAKQKKNTIDLILVIFVIVVIVLFIIIINYRRKTRILQKQESNSERYFEEILPTIDGQNLAELIDMVTSNNSAFLATFLEKLPNFPEKLQAVNSKMVQTEIEFCALLKLNIPTKAIAKYYNIEHRSVQNKKYRIRKKLNIPESMDIYLWFNQF